MAICAVYNIPDYGNVVAELRQQLLFFKVAIGSISDVLAHLGSNLPYRQCLCARWPCELVNKVVEQEICIALGWSRYDSFISVTSLIAQGIGRVSVCGHQNMFTFAVHCETFTAEHSNKCT